MTVRDKTKECRERRGYSIKRMSRKCGVSEILLSWVENGQVTHPNIAERIGKTYGLDTTDIYELMPENHRPGEHYEPDKYMSPIDR